MLFMRFNAVRSGADVISGILNCVCPECGGRMGERGKEFKCQGECLRDWRQTWERALPTRSTRAKTPTRGI
jgi:tRNA(Ile2) C34 agmatinyltransferase TiaS